MLRREIGCPPRSMTVASAMASGIGGESANDEVSRSRSRSARRERRGPGYGRRVIRESSPSSWTGTAGLATLSADGTSASEEGSGSSPATASCCLLVSIGADAGGVVIDAVDEEERPPPARLRAEIQNDAGELPEAIAHRCIRRRPFGVERPVHHERPPLDQRPRHRPTVAGVAGAV